MIHRSLFAVLLVLASCSAAFAQAASDAERSRRSEEIMTRAVQIDLLNQILPVLLSTDQLRQLLPTIERIRQRVRETEKLEFDELRKLESKLEAAYKDGMEKGLVPPRELIGEVFSTYSRLGVSRRLMAEKNAQDVLDKFMEVANAGQQKAAAQALNPRTFDASAKPDEMSQEDRLRLYVREILLHPLAYDILVKLSMRKE
jgi:hypothetical protein